MKRKLSLPKSETKHLNSVILKHSKNIPVKNRGIDGTYTIKAIRFYQNSKVTVHIEFRGKLECYLNKEFGMFDLSKYYNNYKIRINKLIRKKIRKEIHDRLAYFSVELHEFWNSEGIFKIDYPIC